jgi:hypothetical protein
MLEILSYSAWLLRIAEEPDLVAISRTRALSLTFGFGAEGLGCLAEDVFFFAVAIKPLFA